MNQLWVINCKQEHVTKIGVKSNERERVTKKEKYDDTNRLKLVGVQSSTEIYTFWHA